MLCPPRLRSSRTPPTRAAGIRVLSAASVWLLLGSAAAMGEGSAALNQAEGSQHLQHLRAAGVIGICRPVIIRATHVPAGAPRPSLQPGEKLVHFQRHGQGYHNLLAEIYRSKGIHFDSTANDVSDSPYVLPEIVDPPLTQKGREQCAAARPAAAALSPQKIVVSPLSRAIHTALLTFEQYVGDPAVPIVALEDVRESFGRHTCDKRRSVSEMRAEYGHVVDLSLMQSDEDPWWRAEEREPKSLECERIYKFLLWLREQPESELVVVGHSSYLFTMFNAVIECGDDADALHPFFGTCEIRSVVLAFEDIQS